MGPPAAAAAGLQARPAAQAAREAPSPQAPPAHSWRVVVVVAGRRRPPCPAVAKVTIAPENAREPLSTALVGVLCSCSGGARLGCAGAREACGGCAARGRRRARKRLPEPMRTLEAWPELAVPGLHREGHARARTVVESRWAAINALECLHQEAQSRSSLVSRSLPRRDRRDYQSIACRQGWGWAFGEPLWAALGGIGLPHWKSEALETEPVQQNRRPPDRRALDHLGSPDDRPAAQLLEMWGRLARAPHILRAGGRDRPLSGTRSGQ